MAIEVRLPTVLRAAASGQASVFVEGETIGEILKALSGSFPGLGNQVVSADGSLHRFVNVYLNDDDVRYLEKLDTKVAEGDVISILPAVAGGSF